MNCYNAHLSIGVHCSLELKKIIIIIFYSQHSFTLSRSEHSFTLSSSLSSPTRPPQAHPGTTCFFFLFSFYQIRSHSLSLFHCQLSSQASQAHSLNVAAPTIVNVAAIVKFRPTPPICLDALLFRRSTLGQSLSSSCGCFGFLIWVYSSTDPPIHFGFFIWIHFMWMSLFFIFDI